MKRAPRLIAVTQHQKGTEIHKKTEVC